MKLAVLRNLVSAIAALALSFSLSLLLNHFTALRSGSFSLSLVFYTLLFLGFNFFYAYNRGHESFTSLLLGGIVIRLILSLILIIVCRAMGLPGFFPFTMHLIGHYILFTIFEIRYLLTIIKSPRA
jgi:hypothetical protein